MNTELLREDEGSCTPEWALIGAQIELLRQRLIEEREKNAELSKWLMYIVLAVCDPREAVKGNTPSYGKAVEIIIDRMNKAEAELAEERKDSHIDVHRGKEADGDDSHTRETDD